VAAGGESKNYFTFSFAPGKADTANEATFFVWEGSDASGYQLKSYVLRTGPASDLRMDIITAPGDTKTVNGPRTFIKPSVANCPRPLLTCRQPT